MGAPAYNRPYGLAAIIRGSALAALLASLLFMTGCNGPDSEASASSQAQERVVKVRVQTVKPTTVRDVAILPGETEAFQDVMLAAEQEGQVQWIGPKEGEKIAKGTLVAKIDVKAKKARLDRAKATYIYTQSQVKRRLVLHKAKVLPKEELDDMLTKQQLAKGNLDEAQVMYDQGFVHSPVAGVINDLKVDPGEFVRKGEAIAEIVAVDRIKIICHVPEMEVRYLKPRQQSLVTLDAYPERKWIGLIEFVAFKADPTTKTFRVEVIVNNTDGAIRPGMIARAAFLKREIANAVTAPLRAIVDKGGERLVFVEKNGRAKACTIEIGIIETQYAQITKGLKPGDHLIVVGQHDVEEGMKVITK